MEKELLIILVFMLLLVPKISILKTSSIFLFSYNIYNKISYKKVEENGFQNGE